MLPNLKLLAPCIMLFAINAFADSKQDKKVASIDNKAIYESEVKEKITDFAEINSMSPDGNFSYDRLDNDVKQKIIESVILGELVITEAKKAGIENLPEYKRFLEAAKKQLLQKIFLENIMKTAATEARIKEKYQEFIDTQQNQKEYKVSHILVKTEAEAIDIKNKLDKGADFATLAKEYSLDNNKEQGGSMNYFTAGQMVAAFEDATIKLKVGEVSSPVKTDFGYHLIKLEDVRKLQVQTLEQMRSKITDEISNQALQDYIDQLKIKNKVEFFNQ